MRISQQTGVSNIADHVSSRPTYLEGDAEVKPYATEHDKVSQLIMTPNIIPVEMALC